MRKFSILDSSILLLTSLALVQSASNAPGVSFVGVGYNLLLANPDEGDPSRGGIDPGILLTRRIFEITWDEVRPSADQRYTLPDEINFQSRSSCVNNTVNDIVTDAKDLQENLKLGLGLSGGGGIPVLAKFSFSMNPSFKKEVRKNEKEQKVYKKSTKICNLGAARYREGLAGLKKYALSEEFRHVVCQLPPKFDKDQYMKFVHDWGTHVIMEVDVGIKTVKKMESTVGEMFSFASRDMQSGAVKAGGSYQGVDASLELDMGNFKKSETSRKWNKGKSTEYVVGTADQPEPIRLVLSEIDHTLKEKFWKAAKTKCDLEPRKKAIREALERYPDWLNAELPKNKKLKIPLTWPQGEYGLPQADEKCPQTKSFRWIQGYRSQVTGSEFETEPEKEKIHFPAGSFEKVGRYPARYQVTQNFCLKTVKKQTNYAMDWPPGHYCIFKTGDCPSREFEEGTITWDDRTDDSKTGGYVPDGDFNDSQTTFKYCCRDDAPASRTVFLPVDSSFYLLRFGGQCQRVNGMEVIDEMVKWDEPLIGDTNLEGVHPDSTSKRNIELHYCYYFPRGWKAANARTLSTGLFKSASSFKNVGRGL